MKKIIFLFTALISIPSISKIETLDRIAVIVDDGILMESQIDIALEEIVKRYDAQNIPKPAISVLREQTIEKLVVEELQLQMAERAGVRISDAELNSTVARIASNNGMSLEDFILYLDGEGESYQRLRDNIKKEMTVQRVQRGRVGSSINITDKEFEAFLATDESLKQLEPELLVRQILVKTSNEANKVLEKINNSFDFETLARELSISSNALEGGLMNWRKKSDMPSLFAEGLEGVDVGQVSPPLKSGAGYHILKVEEKRGDFVKYEDQWLVRHILLMPSEIRSEEASELELIDIRNRVINGEDFSLLAKEFSEDPGSAQKGGELDWMGKGITAAEFEATFTKIEEGVVSEVFQTEFGFHFLELLGQRNKDMTNEAIENRAFNILYSRKYDEELENTLRSMRAEAFVEIKDLD
ncbi:peptidylprolyl isomerase [Gammaproteobacteria bacterium]|jgi:peptidyl-prolyl cis-trans isomerase SurA|nr:peptidylprolyl isomerase [Gammaproteobacteria bacterium]MDA9143083.1 peptidylprolyl isomerase [Gammaproteobacteria bacterium]MDC3247726.1 peptidylprolyl isomerase [Gammaproteobacteria bacterium]